MSMKTILTVLKVLHRAKVPALLEGVHGIGKTSLAYQLHGHIVNERKAQETGKKLEKEDLASHTGKSTLDARMLAELAHVGPDDFGLWTCSAANLTIEELIGYPKVMEDQKVHYLRSHNFIPPPDHRGGGIWMVDELNLAFQEVERAIMSLALEGRYLDYVLPEGITLITSQNPSIGEYQSRRLNPPTLNRFCWIKATSTPEEVLAYFNERDFHSSILDVIAEHSKVVLNPHQEKADFPNDQVPTSRSWEYVDRVMKVITPSEIEQVGLIIFTGLLGPTAAAVFEKFAKDRGERSIDIKEVLKGYGYDEKTYNLDDTTIKGWPQPKIRKDVKKIVRNASVRMDIVNMALQSLTSELTKISTAVKEQHKGAKAGATLLSSMKPEQIAAVINSFAFLCDLPPDQAGVTFLRSIQGDIFDYTMHPLLDHQIAIDYQETWDKVSESAKAAGG